MRYLVLFILLCTSLFAFSDQVVKDQILYDLDVKAKTASVHGPVPDCTYINNLIIPEKVSYKGEEYIVEKIGEQAFNSRDFKGELTLPNTLKEIGARAFRNSGFTGSLIIPSSVTSIGYSAFYGCSGFTGSLTIGNSVAEISKYAFCGCSGFDTLYLHPMKGDIGHYAFDDTKFMKVVCDAYSPLTIYFDTFPLQNEENTILYVPDGFVTSYHGHTYWRRFKQILPIKEASNIFLDRTDISIIIGDSLKLTATVEPENAFDETIVWTSSDNNIAIVSDDGTVTATSVGVAIITATCGDVSASCTVTVTPMVATSIVLSTSKMELVTGESVKLTATIYPEGAVDKSMRWWSNYPNIATVSDEGTVTAISVGFTKIYASCGKVLATCEVTVKPITASSVILNTSELNLCVGETDKLTATVYPENTMDKRIIWNSDNEAVVIVSNDGTVTAISDGMAKVTAYSYSSNASASCIVNVSQPLIEGQIKYSVNPVTKVATVMGPRDDFEEIRDLIIPGTVKFEDTYYTVEKIAKKAFNSNRNLRGKLTLPNTLKEVGDSAFCECTEIEGFLTIPPSVTRIGEMGFAGCKGLIGSLAIPASVVSMGEYAFGGCDGFTGSLTIPSSVTSIEEGNFSYCSGFTGSLTIPNSVTCIGERAFWNCKGFTGSLVIPNSVTEIGNYAFSDCSGFTSSLTIPNSVTNIGYEAFSFCTGLTEVIISSSVKSIDHYAFSSCTSLKSVYYSAKEPISASGGVFWSNNDQIYEHATLYVPEEAIEECRIIAPWSYFRNIQAYDFATGVVEIEDDINSDEPSEVYNLNGMKISSSMENLAPGLYIVTQGSVVKKINVK